MDPLKLLHVGCALLSAAGFMVRGAWMLTGSPLLGARLTHILPHVIDTVLLASAIALAVRLQQYPFVHGWLTAKVLALLAYIVLGSIALKRGRTRGIRIWALIGASAVLAYIFAVALTRQATVGLA